MFKFSDECQKLKTQLLTLSGVCLFIGLTHALPEKIAIIGLDLSNNKTVSGWFLLAVSAYFLLKFTTLSIIELVKQHLPWVIRVKTKSTQGEIIGLTADECYRELEWQDYDDENTGTVHGELRDIERKNKLIASSIKRWYVIVHNAWRYIIDFSFPIVFGVYSTYLLYAFLSSGNV